MIADDMGVLEAIPASLGNEVLHREVLEQLKNILAIEKAVLLYGFPGVGKSTLAAAYAREALASRPVFWHTVSILDPSPFDTFIRRMALFLTSLGRLEAALFLQPGNLPLPGSVGSLAVHLQAVRPLVCVDEYHHLSQYKETVHFIEQLAHESESTFLLISREHIEHSSVPALPLHGLGQAEAQRLLETWEIPLPPETFANLYHLTQGNPMLLRLATSGLRQHPQQADSFLERLATQGEIASFLVGNALEGLSPPALHLLSLLSILRQPISLLDTDLAERLRDQDLVDDLHATILSLQRRHFLENAAEAGLHPLLREHLAAFLQTRPELYRSLHALAANWFRPSRANTLEALYHYVQAGDVEAIVNLLKETLLQLDSSGQGEAAADLISPLLDQTRQTLALTPDHESQLHSLRGQLLMSGRRAGEAESDFRHALSLALQMEAAPGRRAGLELRLARCLLQRGKVPEADQLCDEAERLAASDTDPGLLAEVGALRSTVRLTQTRLDEAWNAAQASLSQIEPNAHVEVRRAASVRAVAYNVLGILAHIRRDVPAAITFWRQAEEAAILAGNLRTAFRCKANIGGVLFDQGELDEARQTYEGIIEAVQAIGDIFTLGKILNALGAVCHLQGRPAEALDWLDRARHLKQLIGDLQGEANTENQRALVLLTAGKAEEARRSVERLLKQTEETGEMRWRASYLDTLGMTLIKLGKFGTALERLQEAVTLPGAMEDHQLATYIYNHLALAYLGEGDLPEAKTALEKVPETVEGSTAAMDTRLVAALFAAVDQPEEAQKRLRELEKEASRRTLFLYSQAARRVRLALKKGSEISACVRLL
ncbi:MAG: tetratricopeptide repeat protein [Chloroflexi bacterium]|nr:tetratricopeptide repeat protein [Chloroflexota bacterium]